MIVLLTILVFCEKAKNTGTSMQTISSARVFRQPVLSGVTEMPYYDDRDCGPVYPGEFSVS